MTFKPYTDPTTGQWVGEHETRQPDGEVNRQTEWFTTEQQAREFSRTGRVTTAGPVTLAEVAQEIARLGLTVVSAADRHTNPQVRGLADGWATANQIVQGVLVTKQKVWPDDVAALEALAEALDENRRRTLALTRATIGPAERNGRADALTEAHGTVVTALARARQPYRRPRPEPEPDAAEVDSPTLTGVANLSAPRQGRRLSPDVVAGPRDPMTGEDLADWSGYPKLPLTDVNDFSELCLFMGGSYDSFTGELIKLIAKADPGNLNRLAAGFPRHVRAYVMWRACAPVPADTLVKLLEATANFPGGRPTHA